MEHHDCRDGTAHNPSPATDRRHLTGAAYGSAPPLAARQAIYRYLQPPVDVPSFYAARHPQGIRWEARLAEVERRVAEVIDAEGAFTVPLHAGVFVCRLGFG